MINTIMAVVTVSFLVGQVTLATSARTCWRNVNGLVFDAISLMFQCSALQNCSLFANMPIRANDESEPKQQLSKQKTVSFHELRRTEPSCSQARHFNSDLLR